MQSIKEIITKSLKFLWRVALPCLFKWSPLEFRWVLIILVFTNNGILRWLQISFKMLLTWLTLTDILLLSFLINKVEIPTFVSGDSSLILVTRLTMDSAMCLGGGCFKSLVPTCMINLSGFRLVKGFTKSFMSASVAPEKDFSMWKWLGSPLLILAPMTFFTMESPAITTVFFFANLELGNRSFDLLASLEFRADRSTFRLTFESTAVVDCWLLAGRLASLLYCLLLLDFPLLSLCLTLWDCGIPKQRLWF